MQESGTTAYESAQRRLSRDKGYRRSIEIHRRIEALYPRIEEASVYFRAMRPVDSSLPKPPGQIRAVRIDPIVCAIAIKAATTKRAVLTLCDLGDGENALILARVLLENAALLEWLIRGEGRRRLEAYVMFTSVAHERIVELVNRYRRRFLRAGADKDQVASDPQHRAVWTHVFRDHKGRPTRSDRATWEFDRDSGRGRPVGVGELFREVEGSEHSFEYDALYGEIGSDIVHTGPFSLTRTLQLLGSRSTFTLQPIPVADPCAVALASSNTAMFLVLESLSRYLGLDLSADLTPLKARAQADPYGPLEQAAGTSV
jgi:hypothetical protein